MPSIALLIRPKGSTADSGCYRSLAGLEGQQQTLAATDLWLAQRVSSTLWLAGDPRTSDVPLNRSMRLNNGWFILDMRPKAKLAVRLNNACVDISSLCGMAKNGSNFGRIKNRVNLIFFYSMRQIQRCAQIKISMKTNRVVSPAARPMFFFFCCFSKISVTVSDNIFWGFYAEILKYISLNC